MNEPKGAQLDQALLNGDNTTAAGKPLNETASSVDVKPVVQERQTGKAILFMLMGSTSMGSMNIVAKLVSERTQVTVIQMGAFRGFVMALGCYLHCRISGIDFLKLPEGFGFLVLCRAFFGTMSSMLCFFAIFNLPVSLAVVLYFTQPITASVLNYFFNNESLSCLQITAILSSLVGVVFLSCPQLLIPSMENDLRLDMYPNFGLGVGLALSGSLCSGVAYLTMRKLGTSISSVVTTLWFGVFSCIACFAAVLISGDAIVEPINLEAFLLLCGVGFCGWIAQEGVSKAVGLEEASRMAPMNYLQVIIAWVADVTIFDAQIQWTDYIGTVLILIFTFLSTLQKASILPCCRSTPKPAVDEATKDQDDNYVAVK